MLVWVLARITRPSSVMAESEGFEPPDGLTRQQFSRLPHSTTLPTLRAAYSIAIGGVCGFRMKFTFFGHFGSISIAA